MNIAITDNNSARSFPFYLTYLGQRVPQAALKVLSYRTGQPTLPNDIHGLVITGGGDVHPRFYQGEYPSPTCEDVDEMRDDFEIALIHEALDRRIPLFGICRGMQIFNVAMGGTLFDDVELRGFGPHRGSPRGDIVHDVRICPSSSLFHAVQLQSGTINSHHHQAVATPGRNLHACAESPDGVIEAIEWADPSDRSPIVMVQWHPERMPERESPFAQMILTQFIEAVRITASLPIHTM